MLDVLIQPDLAYDYTQITDSDTRTLARRAAQDIKPRLRRAAQDIVVIGQRLAEVRDRLPHGQWTPWLESEFDMTDRHARNFIQVSSRFGGKTEMISDLTPTALYALAAPSTPEDAIVEVEQRIEAGKPPTVAETKQIIANHKPPSPTLPPADKLVVDWTDDDWDAYTANKAAQIPPAPFSPSPGTGGAGSASTDNRDLSVEAETETPRERRITQAQNLPAKTYNVILADPPWQYNNTGLNGAAANHYPTMSLSELGGLLWKLELDIADNAVLFLWVTNPMLEDAFELINNWGFRYKTNIVWVKDRIGTGFYVRGMHELLLICTRGAMTPIETNHTPPITSVLQASTQEHSRKPDQVHDLIQRLYPDCNYIELFARRPRPGWDVWGNEVNQ